MLQGPASRGALAHAMGAAATTRPSAMARPIRSTSQAGERVAMHDYVSLGEVKTYFEEDGPPLALLHPGLADSRAFEDWVPELTEHFHVFPLVGAGMAKRQTSPAPSPTSSWPGHDRLPRADRRWPGVPATSPVQATTGRSSNHRRVGGRAPLLVSSLSISMVLWKRGSQVLRLCREAFAIRFDMRGGRPRCRA